MPARAESPERPGSWRDRRPSAFVSAAATVEALLGLTAVFVIGFGPTVVLAIAALVTFTTAFGDRDLKGVGLSICLAAGFVVTGISAMWTARMASHAASRCLPDWLIRDNGPYTPQPKVRKSHSPLAIVLARRIPHLPTWIRLILCGWWLIHFAAGVGLHVVVVKGIQPALVGLPEVLQLGVLAFGDFAVTFAANVYGIMAITVLTRDWSIVRGVWRFRYVLDVILVAGALWLMP